MVGVGRDLCGSLENKVQSFCPVPGQQECLNLQGEAPERKRPKKC